MWLEKKVEGKGENCAAEDYESPGAEKSFDFVLFHWDTSGSKHILCPKLAVNSNIRIAFFPFFRKMSGRAGAACTCEKTNLKNCIQKLAIGKFI